LQKSLIKKNFSLRILFSSILFLISFFFIFWIASYFDVNIFPLENRATIYTTFQNYIFDKYVDSVIITLLTTLWLCISIRGKLRITTAIIYGSLTVAALLTNSSTVLSVAVLVSIPIIASIFVYNHFSTKKIIQIQTNLLMSFFSFAVLCISIVGLIVTILTFSSESRISGLIQNYAAEIFFLLSSFSPVLLFFLVAGSFVKLLRIKIIKKLENGIKHHTISHNKLKQKRKFLFLSLIMLLSIFFVLIPHQSLINPENEIVGSDTVTYVEWLNNILADDQEDLLYQVFVVHHSGDIPLSLILYLQVLTIFPDNPYQVIDHLPIILSPVLVLTVFFLTREITSNDTISLLASFLTAISFQPLLGIYSGLYANWMALIFGYISFIFMFRFLKRANGTNYLAFSAFLFLMMLSHIFTWTLLIFFLGIFLVISYRIKMFDRKNILLVFLIIMASIAFDSGKSILMDTSFGIERVVNVATINSSYGNPASVWNNLSRTSLVYMGGLFGNFLILSLCIYWLLRSNLREMPNLFIAIFFSIALFPILLGDEVIQTRVLYNIPFQIPAAIGLIYLANQNRGSILVFATSIWILIMSIQSITNFI